MSRAPPEQGARQRESAVYKGVHEHFELPRNAAMASAVAFKTASKPIGSTMNYNESVVAKRIEALFMQSFIIQQVLLAGERL
jgi:hypothetical protein